MAYILLILAFVCNAAANVLLKMGAERAGEGGIISLLYNWHAISGVMLFAVNIVFYFLALRALPLSTAYPIMVGMSFLIASAAAAYILHESVGWPQILGCSLILMGVTLMAFYAR